MLWTFPLPTQNGMPYVLSIHTACQCTLTFTKYIVHGISQSCTSVTVHLSLTTISSCVEDDPSTLHYDGATIQEWCICSVSRKCSVNFQATFAFIKTPYTYVTNALEQNWNVWLGGDSDIPLVYGVKHAVQWYLLLAINVSMYSCSFALFQKGVAAQLNWREKLYCENLILDVATDFHVPDEPLLVRPFLLELCWYLWKLLCFNSKALPERNLNTGQFTGTHWQHRHTCTTNTGTWKKKLYRHPCGRQAPLWTSESF